ncbi:MAG: adenylate/guanylate cyclase domain-containing protein [Alphaproteobacteria bacterium]|nr:adenylate/guanylate cyclase domain-containing protein [Alphaproteobacteria bacterium]
MNREAFLSRLRVMSATMLVIFAASVLFGATLAAGFSWHNAGASIGTAALTGLPIFTFELFYVNSVLGAGFRRWPFSRFVAARFVVWFAWIFVATQLSRRWLWGADGEMLAGANFWWTILFSFSVGFVVVSALTLNRLIGPGVLRNFLLGRYHAPREEQRGLLFIDLVGSTAIAERVGASRFLALMNAFIYDIGEALEGSGGAIYRYVGDEAIITWRVDETRDLSGAVEVPFRLRARIAARGEEYRSHFGVVPGFRAALHAGPLVAGEMGDSKLEIVLLGDTVNTAARIEQCCREFDRDFLVSAEALALIDLPDGAECERLPMTPLKGKSREIQLYALGPAVPAERDERRPASPSRGA